MNAHDWALILYTLCLQSAVGIYLVSRMVVWKEEEKAARMRFLWLAGGLGILGVVASFLHLGYPLNAIRTLSNVGKSWLSREILVTICFGVSWLISLLLERQQVGSRLIRNGWATVTSLIGLALVFVMSMIYQSTAFPTWTTAMTTVSFYATTGLIGTAAIFSGQCFQKSETEPACLPGLVIGGVLFLVVQMIAVAGHATYLGGAGPEAQATAALLSGKWVLLYWARIAFSLVGAAVFMPLAWRFWAKKRLTALPQFAGVLIALVGLGEVMGRILFYVTRVKIGL